MKEKMLTAMIEKARHYGSLYGIMKSSGKEKEAEYYYNLQTGALAIADDFKEEGIITENELKTIEDEFVNAIRRTIGE